MSDFHKVYELNIEQRIYRDIVYSEEKQSDGRYLFEITVDCVNSHKSTEYTVLIDNDRLIVESTVDAWVDSSLHLINIL